MSQFSHLSNEELRQELIKYGIPCGPIGLTTRKVYEKRLEKKMANNSASFTRHDFDKVYEKRLEKTMANDSASFTRHDFDEDDHTESSRIISPQNRYKGRYSSNLNEKRFSPFDEFKNMGSSAWGFFSRSTGTSTPCSDFNYLNKSSTNKYRRSIYSDEGSKQHLSDYSFRIFLVFIAFVIGIFATYLYKMHSSTVYSTVMAGKDLIFNVFNYAFYPLIGLFVVFIVCFGIYKLFNYIKFRNIEHKQTLVKLVDRITDIIYESGFSGVAEPHVRDMLMPPTKRSNEDYKLWLEAAHFINNEDSRVRTEIRLINGTECNVWIWSGAGKQRWQGAAVAETSPSSHPIPSVALSCSLKLRGLNFSNNKIECNGLKNEILAKLPVVPKYIDFSNTNNECIVYIMLKDLNDAKKAFLALHSQWFDGNLITVKYIKDERYAERFPGHT